MGERCLDECCLRDYGISEDFVRQVWRLAPASPRRCEVPVQRFWVAVAQVAGFVVNPERPGKRFEDGKLVSY